MYFLTDGKHDLGRQGQVIQALSENGNYWFVRTFEPGTSKVTVGLVMSVHEMSRWKFYPTLAKVKAAYPAAQAEWDKIERRRSTVGDFLNDVDKVLLDGAEVTPESLFTAYQRWRTDD